MTDYRTLLSEIALPRLVGSPQHARLRGTLLRELEGRGFVVMEHPFVATETQLVRVGAAGHAVACALLLLALPVVHRLLGPWPPAALAVPLLVLACVAMFGALVAAGVMPLTRPRAPRSATNLVAVRGRSRVAVWLAAHGDSKGQPISMATRLAAVVLLALEVPLLAWFLALGGLATGGAATLVLLVPGVIGGVLLGRSGPTNDSPGAVDNATGILTALAVADALPPDAPVGILFTDAEEFGLQGARALVRERAHLLAGTAVVNFDGIDDAGQTIALVHRSGPTAEAVAGALGARRATWLPVLVDGLALGRAAVECVTILRGRLGTALIVHTPRDTAERLTLEGVRGVAGGVVAGLRIANVGWRNPPAGGP